MKNLEGGGGQSKRARWDAGTHIERISATRDKSPDMIQVNEYPLVFIRIPKEWKIANVIFTYVNGYKGEPLNNKPVSLMSIVNKIYQKITKKQWTKYLDKRNTNRQTNWIQKKFI